MKNHLNFDMQDGRGLSALVYMGKYSFSNWFKIMHVAFHESHLLFYYYYYCYNYYFDCLKRYCFKFYENKTFELEVKKMYIVTLKKLEETAENESKSTF